MSSDAKIKRLTKLVADYTCAGRKKGKTVTEKMNDANILSMSAYMGAKDGKGTSWTKAEIQKIAYNFFGKKPNVSKIPSYKSSTKKWISTAPYGKKPYVYAGGDWGDRKPGYKNLKIVQRSKTEYEISFTNTIGSHSNSKISQKVGKTTFRLKKTSKSSYGYIITKIQYKKYNIKLID